MYICPFCGRRFKPKYRSDQKFCSYDCGKKYRGRLRSRASRMVLESKLALKEFSCLFCRQDILENVLAHVRITKYCSDGCRSNYHKMLKREKTACETKKLKPRTCNFCTTVFTPCRPRDKDQRFCSKKCKSEYHKDQIRKASELNRQSVIRHCPICDKAFSPKKTLKQIYCSSRCRNLFPKKIYKALQSCFDAIGTHKEDHAHKLLGYTPRQLHEHVVKDKYWKKLKHDNWHLDHIFPIKAFLDVGIRDVAKICCLENLRPLPGKDNCSKNDLYDPGSFHLWLTGRGWA